MKLKKLLACLIVGTMIVSVPVGVLAGTHSASSVEDILNAIAQDEDDTVTITLASGTYDFSEEQALNLKGKTYTINGEDITLTDVQIVGNGTITISATVENQDNEAALAVYSGEGETLNVTIDGDVNAENLITQTDESGNAVTDEDGNEVRNATGVGNGAEGDASVTVTGNVTSAGTGVHTGENGSVTVKGNVTANDMGVNADGDSTVTVNGSVTSKNDTGVVVQDNSSVTVGNGITAAEYGIITRGDTTVTVNGDINAGDASHDDATGIAADADYDEETDEAIAGTNKSTVTVNGNVTATGTAVNGEDGATVKVTGNVSSTNAIGVYASGASSMEIIGNVTGFWGVGAQDTSKVTITGDVSGIDGEYPGFGLLVNHSANVTVNGNVTGGDGNESAEYGAPAILLNDWGEDEFSGTVTVTGNVTGGNTTGDGIDVNDGSGQGIVIYRYTSGNATVTVGGNVTGGNASGSDSSSGYGITYWNFDDTASVLVPNITVASMNSGNGLTSLYYSLNGEAWTVNSDIIAQLASAVKYTVATEATNGTVKVDKDSYLAGETVTITATPDDGYYTSKVTVTAADGTNAKELTAANGVYTVTMPTDGSGMIVKAEFLGTLTKEDTSGSSSSSVTMDTSVDELGDAVLNAEEKAAVAAGKKVSVWLDAEDISSSVGATDKALVTKALPTNYNVGMYLNLNLLVQIADGNPRSATELASPIQISITIPDSLKNTDPNKTRTYQIIRIHEGVADVLSGTYNSTTSKFSFATDRFSTYALVYTDTDNTTTTNTSVTTSPKTGDTNAAGFWAVLGGVAGVAAVTVVSRKKRNA